MIINFNPLTSLWLGLIYSFCSCLPHLRLTLGDGASGRDGNAAADASFLLEMLKELEIDHLDGKEARHNELLKQVFK